MAYWARREGKAIRNKRKVRIFQNKTGSDEINTLWQDKLQHGVTVSLLHILSLSKMSLSIAVAKFAR